MRMTRPRLAPGGAAAAVVAAMTLAAVLTGCAGNGGGGGGETDVPQTATGSLEHLAAMVPCRPDLQTDADTIRQAICRQGDTKYILLTFSTDRGQREWINTAKDYGGFYLVGRKWVAVGHEDVVAGLRSRLGGTLEQGVRHGEDAHSAGSDGHAGHDTPDGHDG